MLDEKVNGRPVDVAVGPDGALYVSDDFTGSIYRIAYGQASWQAGASPVARAAPRNPLAGLGREQTRAAGARGAALWQATGCAACHDASQAAPNAYRPLNALASKYSLDSITQFLQTPQPPMPAYPFTDAQRRDLGVYLLATHP
jgi:cytochrome c553